MFAVRRKDESSFFKLLIFIIEFQYQAPKILSTIFGSPDQEHLIQRHVISLHGENSPARTHLKRLIWTFKIQQQERFNKIRGGVKLIKRDARRKIRSLLKTIINALH